MATVAYSTNPIFLPVAGFQSMSIPSLAGLMDACDAATSALLGIMNMPCTPNEAGGQVEEWMEEFGFRKQAIIAELEARKPADWFERRVRTSALTRYSSEHCKSELDVIAYLSRLHSGDA